MSAASKASLAKNNAFGPGAPSWNLGFPDGNLTAVEIVVYCPHWLKCVDVITRFVNNGVKSVYLASIINEHRDIPGNEGTKMPPNSTTIMMQYAMRRCGYEEWTVGKHDEWDQPSDWNPSNLHVGLFRPPRLTHPKTPTRAQARRNKTWSCNDEVAPIQFKDLAIHVKKHPTGNDALDLTRCVLYALSHPNEDWRFPTDFKELLAQKLGGERPITLDHLDQQVFGRRSHVNFQTPKNSVRGIRGPPRGTNSTPSKKPANASAAKRTISERGTGRTGAAGGTMRRAAASKTAASKTTNPTAERTRRSARNVNKAVVYDETNEVFTSSDDATPAKKRKLFHPRSPDSDESEYQFDDANVSDDEVIATEGYDFSDMPKFDISKHKTSGAKAPTLEQPTAIQNLRAASTTLPKTTIDPKMKEVVRQFEELPPKYLKPPVLSADRAQIDDLNVHLYGDEKSTSKDQLYATAMSSLNGPRRSPPFRPLHLLTDPEKWDVSDWAENIRWAKSQHALYGSATWREYDDDLERITQHRRKAPWVSEELIRAKIDAGKYTRPAGYVPPATLPPSPNWTMDAELLKLHQDDLKNDEFVRLNGDLLKIDEGSPMMSEEFSHTDGQFPQMDHIPQHMSSYAHMGGLPMTNPTHTIGFPMVNTLQMGGGFPDMDGGFQDMSGFPQF